MTDTEAIDLAKQGDESAWAHLISTYQGLIFNSVRGLYLVGAEHQDLVQEANFGFFKAVRDFNSDKGVPFTAFAGHCIRHHLATVLKMANRLKHNPLNQSLSTDLPLREEEDSGTIIDKIPTTDLGPEALYLQKETRATIDATVSKYLTEEERSSMLPFLHGYQYHEIAESLHRCMKTIDSRIARARRKLRTHSEIRECVPIG